MSSPATRIASLLDPPRNMRESAGCAPARSTNIGEPEAAPIPSIRCDPFAGGMRASVVVKLTIPAVASMAVVCSVAISCWPRVGPAYDVEPAREWCTAEVPIMTLRARVKGSGSDMSGKLEEVKSDRAEGIAARADKRACIR